MLTADGVTMVELLVVLAIMGIISASLTVAAYTPMTASDESAVAAAVNARQEAIGAGHSVTVTVVIEGEQYAVTANPDGLVISDDTTIATHFAGTLSDVRKQ